MSIRTISSLTAEDVINADKHADAAITIMSEYAPKIIEQAKKDGLTELAVGAAFLRVAVQWIVNDFHRSEIPMSEATQLAEEVVIPLIAGQIKERYTNS